MRDERAFGKVKGGLGNREKENIVRSEEFLNSVFALSSHYLFQRHLMDRRLRRH